MFVYDKVLHKGIYNHPNIRDHKTVIANVKKFMQEKPSFEKFSADPFLALDLYIELIDEFGWKPIMFVNATYASLPLKEYPSTEQEKIDYLFSCLCAGTHRNLSLFFEKWRIPVSESKKKLMNKYKTWLPAELSF
jgi:hypothetical protein